ncbi:nitrous oxide reductase accessory protein NosL [Roseateles koreensis]|uniref:Nitrous oxide reductase accessory protein NosL n=1 Tax=Roseateles koreensis TaxID=2987526 RepID=A0ABT5KXF8_9BURK|nr:nitrous oxide reductase accessory protein NosL [Roseateles koreensis]MDC8786442.1 nitrous oxide reductase accessory protein NosL [Roseateles koreensis]
MNEVTHPLHRTLRHPLQRRTLLLAPLLTLALAACGRDEQASPVGPVEIDAHTTCDLDGMLLSDYAGPKGQIHYVGQAQPVFFCDTVELFNTLLRPEQVKPLRAVYVQDMGLADWDQPHGHWFEAKDGFFVLGSKRHGSMGATVASFVREDRARAFMKDWGGHLLRYSEIKADMVDLSGGALHDGRM